MAAISTAVQISEKSILDYFNKQTYLGNAFTFPIAQQTLSNTNETVIALIKNPTTVSGAVNSKALFLNLRTTSSDNASGDGTSFFKYYSQPTISTTGTATVPVNLRPACTTTSVALCYVNGQFTVSANGTLMRVITAGYSSINDSNLLIVLDPGQNMLVTAQAVATGSVIINANSWYEL